MISSDDPSHFCCIYIYIFFCALQTTQVEMLTALLLEMHDVQILTWLHLPPIFSETFEGIVYCFVNSLIVFIYKRWSTFLCLNPYCIPS